ncbi:MAG: tryptophan synthase subunit alpha [Flavobacteriales bacterium]|nr:tryptophan synthase subunit alpha [Flavobacteriales bacterium]
MNRIDTLFKQRTRPVLSVYFTAGHPEAHTSVDIIRNLQNSGVDMIEVGIPFSDPLADGPTIQRSSEIALKNGMNLPALFSELKDIRKDVTLPLVMMGYLNPILQYGMEKFAQDCKATGIDGVIIPDLPLDEYTGKYKSLFEANGLHFICLITPETSDARILEIDRQTGGFIYMVAASSTTGAKSNITGTQQAYFARVNGLKLQHPRLIGFGISNKETYEAATQYADGVIIGSAFIKAVEGKGKELKEAVGEFVKQIRN